MINDKPRPRQTASGKGDAFLGEFYSASAALKQLLAKFVLQCGELRRKRRLRHVQTLGGAGDVPLLRNGKKVSEYP
jgi:hypothetical protein